MVCELRRWRNFLSSIAKCPPKTSWQKRRGSAILLASIGVASASAFGSHQFGVMQRRLRNFGAYASERKQFGENMESSRDFPPDCEWSATSEPGG